MAGNSEVTFNKIPAPRQRRAGTTNQPWYDVRCEKAKNKMLQTGNRYRRLGLPLPPKYYGQKKYYKDLITRKEAAYRKTLMFSMSKTSLTDPHRWWTTLWKLIKTNRPGNIRSEIKVDEWKTHFQGLLNATPTGDRDDSKPHDVLGVTAADITQRMEANQTGNGPITREEVDKVVQRLQPRKAMYFDRVPNEMSKNLHRVQSTILPTIFNHIFQMGTFPQEWSKAYLKPIYKKGDKLNLSNYNGHSHQPLYG